MRRLWTCSKKATAVVLACSLLTGTAAYGLWTDASGSSDARTSFSSAVSNAVNSLGTNFFATGLSFEMTVTNKLLTLATVPQWCIDTNQSFMRVPL